MYLIKLCKNNLYAKLAQKLSNSYSCFLQCISYILVCFAQYYMFIKCEFHCDNLPQLHNTLGQIVQCVLNNSSFQLSNKSIIADTWQDKVTSKYFVLGVDVYSTLYTV